MHKETMLNILNDEIIAKFKNAIEIGRWQNGDKLSGEQIALCMQAVMVWEHEHLPVDQRTGYVAKPTDNGQLLGADCDVEHHRHYPNHPADHNISHANWGDNNSDDNSDDYQQNIAKLLTGQYAIEQTVKFKEK